MYHSSETEKGLKLKEWIINITENPAIVQIRLWEDKATMLLKGLYY